MRLLKRCWALLRVVRSARRNRVDLQRWLIRRPQLLAATVVGEAALVTSNRVDLRRKQLAEMKAAALIGCEFCIDIGAALARAEGLHEAEILELHRFEESDAFDELDRQVLRFAEALTVTPSVVDPALRDDLVRHLGKAGVAELAYLIAWENKRARLNQALGVQPAGFSDGQACAVSSLA